MRAALASAVAALTLLLLPVPPPAVAEVRPQRAAVAPPDVIAAPLAPRAITTWSAGLPAGASGAFVATVNAAARSSPLLVTVGPGPGAPPLVRISDALGNPYSEFLAYDARFLGGVSVALCRFNVPGDLAVVTGAGPGGGPNVRVSGTDGSFRFGFFAYDAAFAGGVTVGCGDLDGDGRDEIVTAPGAGGGPNVRVFGLEGTLRASFFAYDAAFAGGVHAAAGTDGSGPVIITGAGSGGGPNVRSFTPGGTLRHSVFCFDPRFQGGVEVAAGDVDGDGDGDVACGAGAGPRVVGFLPSDLDAGRPPLPQLNGGGTAGGTRIAIGRFGRAGLAVTSGPGGPATVSTYVAAAPPVPPLVLGAQAGQSDYVSVVEADGPYVADAGSAGSSPVWLGNGTGRFAFVEIGSKLSDPFKISVMHHDGSGLRRIAGAASFPLVAARSAPLLAFYEFSNGQPTFVDVVRADGTGRRRVATHPTALMYSPALSIDPSGSRIAVSGPASLGATASIDIAFSNGTGQHPLTSPPIGGQDMDPAFSPDGLTVAYCRGTALRLIQVDGTADHQILNTGCRAPSWSPDGARLALGTDTVTMVVPATGGTPTPVQAGSGGTSWSPDSTRISVGEYGNEGLYIAAAAGSSAVLRGHAGGYTQWAPAPFG